MAELFSSSFSSCCSQSFRHVSLCLIFQFFHFGFDALIRLVHWRRLIQFILSCYFVFIDTHVYVFYRIQANKSTVTEVLEFDNDFDASPNLDK